MVGALYAPPKTLRKSVLTGVANMPPAALAFLTMSALTSFFNWSLFLATVPVKSLRAARVASRLLSSLAGSATVRTADRWNFTAWPSGSRKCAPARTMGCLLFWTRSLPSRPGFAS